MNTLAPLGDSLFDMVPVALAGYVLYSAVVGMEGTAAGIAREPQATSVMIAAIGLLIGFERARRRASVPIGLGIFSCAFALTFSGLKFV